MSEKELEGQMGVGDFEAADAELAKESEQDSIDKIRPSLEMDDDVFIEATTLLQTLFDENKIGALSDASFRLRGIKDEINDYLKCVQGLLDSCEYHTIGLMEKLEMESFKGQRGSISKKVSLYPSITDMGEFIKFIYENERFDMIQKRVSEGSFREYYDTNGAYPDGLDAYPKTKLNYRKA